jgi:hypothetical protein
MEGRETVSSLYDDLAERLERDPRLTKRGGARYDLALLLFDFREPLHELWEAAGRHLRAPDPEELERLRGAVEKLRPLFGERSEPGPGAWAASRREGPTCH